MEKAQLIDVKLVWYGRDDDIIATADAKARLTTTQVIVIAATVTSGKYACPANPDRPYRFKRDGGGPVPARFTQWRLGPGESERLFNEYGI